MRVPRFLFVILAMAVISFPTWPMPPQKRGKTQPVPSDDPTLKLFTLLDSSFAGKLADFYLLGDVYKGADHPDQELQHVLRVEYNKNVFFGKFKIDVRGIGKPTEEQLKIYSIQQFYDGGSEAERFAKLEAGPFGREGDLYVYTKGDAPLASAPITPEVQAEYQRLLTQYVIPALEKKKAADQPPTR